MTVQKIVSEEKKYLVVTQIKTKKEVEIDGLFQLYAELDAQITALQAQQKEVLEQLAEKTLKSKDFNTYINGDKKITFVVKNTNRFDTTKFKQDLPSLYTQYQVASHSEYYQIGKVSEADRKFIKNGK